MSMLQTAFGPVPAGTVNINVSASSQRVQALTFVPSANSEWCIRCYNDGTATVWLEVGDSTVTASTTTSMPLNTKATTIIRLPGGTSGQYVAAIAAGATGIVYFTPGV